MRGLLDKHSTEGTDHKTLAMGREFSDIHPELQPVARKAPKLTFSKKNLWLINALMHLAPLSKPPQDILLSNIFIPGQNDRSTIRLRIYKPQSVAAPAPVLLWLHGGLAASLVHLAHDRQEIKPIFQLLVYPMLDDRTVLRSDVDDHNHVTWNQKSNRYGWESYLGRKCGEDYVPEYSVPARRKDLSGLPRAWIGVGTVDIFHDEDIIYAQRLMEQDVECEVCVISGAFHGFDVFDPKLQIVREFRKSQISALKKAFFE